MFDALNSSNLPHADQIVCVTWEQGLTVSRPGKGDTISRRCFASDVDHVWTQLIYKRLGLKILKINIKCGW